MASREISLDDLLLDHDNPRISRADSQREALQKILTDQDFRLAVLAQSIVEDGLNPMDRLLVIADAEDPKKYIVIEGNRRLAAMRLLKNPAVLTDLEARPAIQRRFEALAKGFSADTISPISCFEMEDRASGATWIKLRHTGENGGKGIVDWQGLATARFRGQDPALQALDLVLKFGNLTDEEKEGIEDRFPITTLDRLLSSVPVRERLGIEVKRNKLLTSLPPEEVIKPLRRIVRELANRTINVTNLKRQDQQIAWVGQLGDDLPDLTKKSVETKAVETFETVDEKSSEPKPKPKPQPKPKPPQRKTLIPRDCILNISNAKISEIVGELRTLPLDTYKHSISVLFRVFLELSVDHYIDAHKVAGVTNQNKLRQKLTSVIQHLVDNGTSKKELDGVNKALSDQQSPLHMDTLGSGLIVQSQNRTVAARAMAEKKTVGHRS